MKYTTIFPGVLQAYLTRSCPCWCAQLALIVGESAAVSRVQLGHLWSKWNSRQVCQCIPLQPLQLSQECSCKTCFQSPHVVPQNPIAAFPPLTSCSLLHQILEFSSPAWLESPPLKEATHQDPSQYWHPSGDMNSWLSEPLLLAALKQSLKTYLNKYFLFIKIQLCFFFFLKMWY